MTESRRSPTEPFFSKTRRMFLRNPEARRTKTNSKSRANATPIRLPFLCSIAEKTEKAPTRKAAEPKIAKGSTQLQSCLPISLLREGERSQKLDEDELKIRARAIEDKCLEFDVQGRVTQINPGPVVTTFEFKPEAGIKYSRIIA